IPEANTGIKGNFLKSLWAGIFHSISAVNNAGLDILAKDSIHSFSRGWGTLLSIVFAVCSVVGGIGYPALYEFKEWLLKKRSKQKTKNIFSLFTKISILMYFSITVLAGGGVILAEYTTGNKTSLNNCCKKDCCNDFKDIEKIWQLVYLVISSRSAGFYGIDPACLHEKSQWILLMLMFIGASPASTAGGIRSITLFLMLGKIWVTMRGRRTLSIFSRSISDQTIDSAYIVFFVSSALITLCSLGIPNEKNEPQSRHASLFEAASAFGTAGLSLGVSGKTTELGKVLLMCLMFIGQLGIPNSLLYYNKPRVSKQKFSYPEEKLRIA
ncbi:TrkH family potassium uptake protein, partial [Mycoplasma wenyonii]